MNDTICCPLNDWEGDWDDEEEWEKCERYFRQELRTVTKPRSCTECGAVIPARAQHEFARGIHRGRRWVERTCMLCREIREHFNCAGFYVGHLWDDLGENFLPDMRAGGPCLEGLSASAKEALFEAKRRQMGLEDDA